MKAWLVRAVTALAILYPAALVCVLLLWWVAGDTWWPSGLLLYLPRIGA